MDQQSSGLARKELTPVVIILVTIAVVFILFIATFVAFVLLTLYVDDFSDVEVVEEVSLPVTCYVDMPA